MKVQSQSALTYVLLGLVPYTRANLLLSFKPTEFFNELERRSNYSQQTLRAAYRRAQRDNIVYEKNGVFDFSLKAQQTVAPFVAENLRGGGQLMVVFDVPRHADEVRRKLRQVLRQLGFRQVQQSVWISEKDYRLVLQETIETLNAHDWVEIYEAAPIRTK